MTTRIRFVRALDVFEAFPNLRRTAPVPEGDVAPLEFVRSLLLTRRSTDAIVLLAHVLPRREVVWWARQCVVAVLGPAADDAARAAEAWVRTPDEATRRLALELGQSSDLRQASTWLARAAGFSGGSIIAEDQPAILPAPDACAQAAAAAVTLAVTQQPPLSIRPWIEACVKGGASFAEGGEARIDPPRR